MKYVKYWALFCAGVISVICVVKPNLGLVMLVLFDLGIVAFANYIEKEFTEDTKQIILDK